MSDVLITVCSCGNDSFQCFSSRLLLLQGELYCATGNATLATEPLLNCLTLCREHHFSYMAAMATVYLAFVQVMTIVDL